MSASPPEKSAEQGDATPDNNSESMDRGEEVQAREAYDFEVKEQDRWLPIANGWLHAILSCVILVLWIAHFRRKTMHDDGNPRIAVAYWKLHAQRMFASFSTVQRSTSTPA